MSERGANCMHRQLRTTLSPRGRREERLRTATKVRFKQKPREHQLTESLILAS